MQAGRNSLWKLLNKRKKYISYPIAIKAYLYKNLHVKYLHKFLICEWSWINVDENFNY